MAEQPKYFKRKVKETITYWEIYDGKGNRIDYVEKNGKLIDRFSVGKPDTVVVEQISPLSEFEQAAHQKGSLEHPSEEY